jgi:hypothetical protein
MASERQIAANRRNAQKSSGPRSVAGKTRASRNAYRHGLAAVRHSETCAVEIDALAVEIAAAATGSVVAALDSGVLTRPHGRARRTRCGPDPRYESRYHERTDVSSQFASRSGLA